MAHYVYSVQDILKYNRKGAHRQEPTRMKQGLGLKVHAITILNGF